ncbi:MAG: hypothetical protein CVV64_01000 [Candidatus Wallbacteria bacterium HGW-Wallbacteria-1]|jgi:hypothetical protein|uniref:RNA-binding protein KhpB N-terminal domain-containing protein n=1 Tax=Candidatus Wallbacteria bacterium HGW-Wallbacteria-1 TaxID=2013854 RepID=A0A2N1PUJ8_9BACT|nr:MAG: hypothetical protein CVV64_01000 [Candidatus Wallbacteria bacterium HGW-Wallbacteria-1]
MRIEGKSKEECLNRAASELGVDRNKIDFTVVQEGTHGFMGFSAKNWIIEINTASSPEDPSVNSANAVSKDQVSQQSPSADLIQAAHGGTGKAVSEKQPDDTEVTTDTKTGRDKSLDGNFTIDVKKDGVFFAITPPKAGGREVDLFRVKLEIDKRHLVHVNYAIVEMALLEASGRAVKIADYDPEVYHDGRADLRLTNDKMQVFMTLVPPHCGSCVTYEKVTRQLELKGVVLGINHDLIRAAIEKDIFDREVLIAEGIPPIDGENGFIDYKFQVKQTKLKPHEMEDGSVDFRELDLITNVTKGELLAEKVSPTKGKEGIRVTGEAVPPKPGRDVIIKAGLNTKLSEDGMRLYSLIDGQVTLGNNGVRVNPILEIGGDVDFTVGNIDFIGSVFIHGKVIDGFTIKARDDIIIAGNVEAAVIRAGGSVKIKSGVVGKERAVIEADGDIYAKFCEMATLRAGGNIIIGKAILHSYCVAGGSVLLDGTKTTLVGGVIKAGHVVDAHIIGSPLATKTVIEVGVDPALTERLKEINENRKNYTENMETLDKAISMLLKQKSFDTLTPRKDDLLQKSIETRSQLNEEIKRLEFEEDEITNKIMESKGGEVKGRILIYPGVKVTIATAIRYIKEELKASALVFENGEVKVSMIHD